MKTKTQTKQQKIDSTLKMYALNGYNLLKTSRDTGIARSTIRKWAEGREIYKPGKDQNYNTETVSIEEIEKRCKHKVSNLKEALIGKMTEMLPYITPTSQGLDVLGRVYKAVLDSNDKGEEAQASKGTMTFLQIVENQIKIKK